MLVPAHALPHAMRWLLPLWGSAKPADKPGAP
jgi:hypothetical protein